MSLLQFCRKKFQDPMKWNMSQRICLSARLNVIMFIALWNLTSGSEAALPRRLPEFTTTWFLIMTSSNGNFFRATGHLCGEFTGPAEFPAQRPVARSFDVFFDLRSNKRLSKQSWGWWFETSSWSLWRQCNAETERELITIVSRSNIFHGALSIKASSFTE